MIPTISIYGNTKRTIKKCNLSVFSNPYSAGIIAIKLDEDDRLIGVSLTDGNHAIVLEVTQDGMSIRFDESETREMGRTARGVRGIRLDKSDQVVGMVTSNDETETLLVVTENGYGKRTSLEETDNNHVVVKVQLLSRPLAKWDCCSSKGCK